MAWVASLGLAACGDGGGTDKPGPPSVTGLTLTTMEDTPVMGTVAAHDSAGHVLPVQITPAMHGNATVSNNVVTYTPAINYSGTDSITVTVADGELTAEAKIEITVTPVNDGPTVRDVSQAGEEDTAVVTPIATLIAAAADVDHDAIGLASVGNPSHGTVAQSGDNVTFTPDHNFSGAASYEFTVSDGHATAKAKVNIAVGGINDPPTAVKDTLTTAEDTSLVIAASELSKNDTDPENQNLSVTAVSGELHGTVSLDAGTVTFKPDADFAGLAGFDYKVTDGAAEATGHADVNVTGVNDPPVANLDALTAVEDTAKTFAGVELTGNDTDIDSTTLKVTEVTNGIHCTVSVSNGDVIFEADPNFEGEATFEYTVSDDGNLTATAGGKVTVTGVNDPPVAGPDSVLGTEDASQTIPAAALLGNDTDVENQTLSITAVNSVAHCTVTLSGTDVLFKPDADFAGDATFTYSVSDTAAESTGLVTVKLAPVNDAPVAHDDPASTELNQPVDIPVATLLGNDTDIDSQTLTISKTQSNVHGTAVLAGDTITFTPETDYIGPASFEYVVSDGALDAIGTVNVTVFTTAVCGDGAVTGLEKCDDSNVIPGDGCSATCKVELGYVCTGEPSACHTVCGDTIKAGAEECDDGNTTPGDGCNAVCVREKCGDGSVNNAGVEQCDDGNTNPGDGCGATCQIEEGYACSGEPSSCHTVCGDGILIGNEGCDDGNTVSGDGCTATCVKEKCGDGTTNNAGTEQCDDGNIDDTDGCTTKCVTGVVCTAAAIPGGAAYAVDSDTGECYVSFSDTKSWNASETACVALGGHLATITTGGEEAVVDAVHNPVQVPWLGAQDDANTTDTVFAWVTGEPWGTPHFAEGQPDNTPTPADCVQIVNAAHEWADDTCATEHQRICEFEVAPCGDGVLQTATGEECDDGGNTSGDGCSAKCKLEVLTRFTFTGATGQEQNFTADTPLAAGVNALPVMDHGPGTLHTTGAGNVFIGTSWNTAAIDLDAYFTFTIVPADGFALNFSSLVFDNQRSGTGPPSIVIRSSLDNFTADLGTFTSSNGTLAKITLPLGAAFKSLIAPVTLRIYAFGASAAGGTFRVDNVFLFGTATTP